MANKENQNQGKLPIGLFLVVGALGLVAFIGMKGIGFNIRGIGSVDPGKRPPTGDPIKVVLVAELDPKQTMDRAQIDFTYANVGAAFKDEKAASATLAVTREHPKHEVVLTFPCAASYQFHISSRSTLQIPAGIVEGSGSGTGSLTLKDGDRLRYWIDGKDSKVQRTGTGLATTYRTFLQIHKPEDETKDKKAPEVVKEDEEKKQREAERKKAADEEARRLAALRKAEAKAAPYLKFAKKLIEGNRAKARERLEEIIRDYPGTEAAKEAKELLDGMR